MSERINTPEQRDKRAEVMVRFLDFAEHIELLQGKKVEEAFGSERNRHELLKNLSEGQFFELVNGTNGILRGKEKGEWRIDGGKVILTGFVGEHTPPRQEDKAMLLRKAFEEAKRMNQSGRSLEDIAILLAASINEVHPYTDANGRTSRLLYTLLTKGYSKQTKAEIKNILGEYGSEVIDINPGLIVRELSDILNDEIGLNDLEKNPYRINNIFYAGRLEKSWFRKEVPSELIKEFFNTLRHDSTYMNLTMYLYIREHPEVEKYIKSFPTYRTPPAHSSVMLEQLIPDLTEGELRKIMESYWELKKRNSELLIDSIAHPEKPEYLVKNDNEETTPLLDSFKVRIRQRLLKASG